MRAAVLATVAGLAMAAVVVSAQGGTAAPKGGAQPKAAAEPKQAAGTGSVARGKYLVTAMGCNDCHTPWKLGPNGPEPEMDKFLGGHHGGPFPPPPAPSGPWNGSLGATSTAFAGPWGVSYTANLTPDPETGLGQWTEQQFVDTIRSGRHQGRGREILPPMPWPAFRNLNDADLKSIFAYLKTIKPIKNKVPDPVIATPGK